MRTVAEVNVVVDYGLGNPKSVQNMLRRTGIDASISCEPSVLRSASRLILPGVGHFAFAIQSLYRLELVNVLSERVLSSRVPILGICLGAQLFGRSSQEADCPGLNWVPMDTIRFDPSRMKRAEKVPHMGWAETCYKDCDLFQGMTGTPRFYYVHSYHFHCDHPELVICTAEHGYRFPSGIAYGNIFGVQFHPEKSHVYGQQLLKNFISMQFN